MTKYFWVLILAICFCGTAAALENPYRTYREAAERISIDIEAANNAALLLEQFRTNGEVDETNKYKAIPDGMNGTLIKTRRKTPCFSYGDTSRLQSYALKSSCLAIRRYAILFCRE